jgi:site-specific recombinase
MPILAGDPVQALALLPLDQGEETERQWLQNTLGWLKSAPPEARTDRLRHLAQGLRKLPDAQLRFQKLWGRACPSRLFAEAGLPEAASLWRELTARVKRRILPQLEDELDLYAALQLTDLDACDAEWIAGLDESDLCDWRALLGASSVHMVAAIRLLAVRAASIGMSRDVTKVMPHRCEAESVFWSLLDATDRFAQSNIAADTCARLQQTIMDCRAAADIAHARLEETGVSSHLVFRLDLMIAQVDRMAALLRLCGGEEDGRQFAALLVRGFAEERGLHNLVRNSVNRMASRVVAHTGKTGEHYIAASPQEWWKMSYGAIGAGAITAFTALFKYIFTFMALAPLWTGIAHSVNYAASFVLMQLLGWSLASKMPSMTAAALGAALEKDDGMRSEVNIVTAITRTQTIVTLGNLLGAIPVSILIDVFIQWRIGNPFLSPEAAMHGVTSMHLWRSFTIPFAALTGCLLWLSSLVAGWTANWMVLHRLPAAMAQGRRLRRLLGAESAVELARIVEHHFAGVIGYICLGVLLGLLPFIGVFAGIPLEVRHVTLASASLAYAVSSLAWSGAAPWRDIFWALCGLAATGIMNFGVSFALGLWLAMRARNLDPSGRRKLVAALWREFWRRPDRFFWRFERA